MKCAVCGDVGSEDMLQCPSCKSVSYCTIDHQKQDWLNHQNHCSFISIELRKVQVEGETQSESDQLEEKKFKVVAVAPRDFEQGEIILDERPLFNIPVSHCCGPACNAFDPAGFCADAKVFGRMSFAQDLQCLTCGFIVWQPEQKCSKCSAPICSIECEQAAAHSENECSFFVKCLLESRPLVFGKHSGGEENCLMKSVILIRIQKVKEVQPEVWDIIKSLVDPTLKFNNDYEMLQWLMKVKGFQHIDISASEIYDRESLTGNTFSRISCLYKIGSQIDHSCAPNCVMELGNFPDFRMRVRASVPIKKGEILNISRLFGHANDQGTVFRRQAIMHRYNYICQCKMCSDVTELGSFQSAVTCINCRDSPVQQEKEKQREENAMEEEESDGKLSGYFLPANSSAGANWVCGGCGLEKSEQEIVSLIKTLEENEDPLKPFDFKKVHSEKILHANHFLIRMTLHGYLALINFKGEGKYLQVYLEAIKYLLKVNSKISPGLNSYAASIELIAADCLLVTLAETPLPTSSVEQMYKLLRMVKECDEYLGKALLYYGNDPPERGAEICKTAADILQQREVLKGIKARIAKV